MNDLKEIRPERRNDARHWNVGSAHGNAKLGEFDVVCIRIRVERGEKQVDLAKEFGVTPPTINRIVNGKQWGHV